MKKKPLFLLRNTIVRLRKDSALRVRTGTLVLLVGGLILSAIALNAANKSDDDKKAVAAPGYGVSGCRKTK
jgi:hypothetical protein